MDLTNIKQIAHAGSSTRKEILRIGFALVFMIAVMLYVGNTVEPVAHHYLLLLIIAVVIGDYMALNIGAIDVANNVGPAVGSQALTMTGAIIIAATFEASGALITGGDVVSTIKDSIIDPSMLRDSDIYLADNGGSVSCRHLA